MLPAKEQILICPHCGGEKSVLQLASGNTFGAVLWSDNKQIARHLPKVSFVQRCPKCGHYYLLTQVKETKQGEHYSWDEGILSWIEMKEAIAESTEWNLDDNETLSFMLTAIWAYNDEFYRKENPSTPGSEDVEVKRQIIEKLLTCVPDKILLAEFNREMGNFDEAISIIEAANPTDEFLIDIASKILSRAKEHDDKPFIIQGEI